MEKTVTRESRIFQLPYDVFPESKTKIQYSNLRPYLNTSTLYYSYGSMVGRYWSDWQQQVSQLPTNELIDRVRSAGFTGILINHGAYQDGGEPAVKQIEDYLHRTGISDGTVGFVYFSLDSIKQKEIDPSIEYPLTHSWPSGCHQLEKNKDGAWRWCGNEAVLKINNPEDESVRIKLNMTLLKLTEGRSDLKIYLGGNKIDILQLNEDHAKTYENTFLLSPGLNTIKLTLNGRPRVLGTDKRLLVFNIRNFTITDLRNNTILKD